MTGGGGSRKSDLIKTIHTYNLYLNTIKISKLTSMWGRVLNKIHKKLELKIKIILIKYNFDKNK